jgi:hypothetical protein
MYLLPLNRYSYKTQGWGASRLFGNTITWSGLCFSKCTVDGSKSIERLCPVKQDERRNMATLLEYNFYSRAPRAYVQPRPDCSSPSSQTHTSATRVRFPVDGYLSSPLLYTYCDAARTQPLIQWVLCGMSPGIKWPVNQSHSPSPVVRNTQSLKLLLAKRIHGAMLNWRQGERF